MGLFRKMMGKPNSDAGPSGAPPPGNARHEDRKDEKKDQAQDFAPPPGPPPSHLQRGRSAVTDEFQPPPGPPPSHLQHGSPEVTEYFQPPPGPPPGKDEEPPSYHDWQTAVPDTSLLPPPPVAANDQSPTSNADRSEADRASDWCRANPLRKAIHPSKEEASLTRKGQVSLLSPSLRTPAKLMELRDGVWSGTTKPKAKDICFSTNLPLYYPFAPYSPKICGQPVAAYFEVHVNRIGSPDADGNLPSLAIGFVAAPYPIWRMPGWQRGSLAVHSDDGRRYVNNQDGGVDFVEPFCAGDVVGLGVRFWNESWGGGATNNLKGEAFFTRNGQVEGTWSLQEETDAEDVLGNLGLEGDHDLFGAVGTYGEIGFKAVFVPEAWVFKPKEGQIPGLVSPNYHPEVNLAAGNWPAYMTVLN